MWMGCVAAEEEAAAAVPRFSTETRRCATSVLSLLSGLLPDRDRSAVYLRIASVFLATKVVLAANASPMEGEVRYAVLEALFRYARSIRPPRAPDLLDMEGHVLAAFRFKYFCGAMARSARMHLPGGRAERTVERLKRIALSLPRVAGPPPPPPPLPGDVAARYDVRRRIGKGTFGDVYRAVRREDGAEMAVKRIDVDAKANFGLSEDELREIFIVRENPNPHVVPFVDVAYSAVDRTLMLYMPLLVDLLSYGEGLLYRPSTSLPELERRGGVVLSAAKQLLLALCFLKGRGILHRDIKPENVLVDDERGLFRLADFGSARLHDPRSGRRMTSGMVTLWYRAPELLLGRPYGASADAWSVACVLVELASGEVWFRGKTELQELELIFGTLGSEGGEEEGGVTFAPQLRQNPIFHFKDEAYLALREEDREGFYALVEGMAVVDPEERISPERALSRPWVASLPERFRAPSSQ